MEKEKRKWYSFTWWNVIQVFLIGLAGFIMGVVATFYMIFKNI